MSSEKIEVQQDQQTHEQPQSDELTKGGQKALRKNPASEQKTQNEEGNNDQTIQSKESKTETKVDQDDQELQNEETTEEEVEIDDHVGSVELPAANFALLQSLSSEYFLNKHTPSFKCLEQYLCSRSDLQVTLSFFPPPTDPELDDAFNYIPPEEEPDPTGCDKYVRMCKDLTIVPIKRIINSLETDTLNLKFYGLTLKQMRGIADALKVNSNIRYLVFQDNWMSPEATILISDILRENNSIRILNLRECRIGEEGAEKLSEGISTTQFLQELDLSYNSLGDVGLKSLQSSLMENTSIKKLNISHNNLTEDSGATLEQILLENKALEELDLSWNGFYTGPAWNGIGTRPAVSPIQKYLKKTKVLQFLDLSFNRITQSALRILRNALVRNKSLNKIKLGNNIYTPDEAYFLASLLLKAKNNLTYLDMEDMSKISKAHKTVTHGRILSNYEIYGPNVNKLLFQRCRYLAMKPKKKKAKKDFGLYALNITFARLQCNFFSHFVLSLPDASITKEEFQIFLKKKKVKKLDKDLLNELMSRFATKNLKVNCVALKTAYMEIYPDTVLPAEKKKKKKKGRKKGKKKKEKQENGEKQENEVKEGNEVKQEDEERKEEVKE
ncbi:uncharacterized protein BDFB_009622 [Asbolus verrucosus]|uniref:Uncharacterized protein n=1 Tax=Asbolus verrucosus TaxID=1661398 RepID=A0A482W324_ASBVE|nr:uncharacterized protein BDFB_009622 [Asbolus verrucosus]